MHNVVVTDFFLELLEMSEISDKIAGLASEMTFSTANVVAVSGFVLRGSVRVLENYRYLCNLFNK